MPRQFDVSERVEMVTQFPLESTWYSQVPLLASWVYAQIKTPLMSEPASASVGVEDRMSSTESPAGLVTSSATLASDAAPPSGASLSNSPLIVEVVAGSTDASWLPPVEPLSVISVRSTTRSASVGLSSVFLYFKPSTRVFICVAVSDIPVRATVSVVPALVIW